MTQMTPKEIAHELDKHIIGQASAKRSVAIALRNRWRRAQVNGAMRDEITPKNILMIGPTGVGKTEIARRLARLAARSVWRTGCGPMPVRVSSVRSPPCAPPRHARHARQP